MVDQKEVRRGRLDARSLLKDPANYLAFARLVRRSNASRLLVDEFVRPFAGAKILDIGCGPADILNYLDDVRYVGFDADARYIAKARADHGDRGEFHCELVDKMNLPDPGTFDIVLASGLLHHLDDDEAGALCSIARRALKPSGRMVTIDPLYTTRQNPVARFIIAQDRGSYVRREDEYLPLVQESFPHIEATVRTDLLRLPYTHLIMTCSSEESASPPPRQSAD